MTISVLVLIIVIGAMARCAKIQLSSRRKEARRERGKTVTSGRVDHMLPLRTGTISERHLLICCWEIRPAAAKEDDNGRRGKEIEQV